MMDIGRWSWRLIVTAAIWCGPLLADEDDAHGHGELSDGEVVRLSPAEQEAAGVHTQRLAKQSIAHTIELPAEVQIDAYRASHVASKVMAKVEQRHVRLGEEVRRGQSLVTLSSIEMAQAQGELIIAEREWRLVQALGEKAVAARRYTQAQVAYQQAVGRVQSFGMDDADITAFLESVDASAAVGIFTLSAPQDGTVVRDSFRAGELVAPGRVLFEIVDESTVWVDARTLGTRIADIGRGATVRVRSQDATVEGTVVGVEHRLDEVTRTRGLRIEVNNRAHLLHPGQFVTVEVSIGTSEETLAVPNSALTLIGGRESVFVREGRQDFHPRAIQLGVRAGSYSEVATGLVAGEHVVVNGVFHLKSLLLKSSLGEGHAH